jgi:membrane-bound ClpP family serine protease
MILQHLIANPDLALIFILAGILLLYAEFNRPGTVVFACLGTLLATPSLYALAQHPINRESLFDIAFGISCLLASIVYPTRRLKRVMLIVGGIRNPDTSLVSPDPVTPGHIVRALISTLFLAGGLFLLIPAKPGIHLTTALLVSLTFSSVTFWLGRIALQARRNKRLPNPTLHPAVSARRVD